ncbi:hypothetical protein PENSPDRAFT_655794 [Peniophora sp. CONT]|nr:hypothetical protein PENSPDRAFT_655794 [Peniophora sp. CONT]
MTIKSLPAIGTRISSAGSLGTIKYVGPVSGTKGEWLGVEWDDAARGKHDGVKDGERYFECLVPNSGSFIRPSAPQLDYGRSFLRALVDKYVELPQGPSGSEYVTLGSSHGAIQVEAVNLDKIRDKFSNLERLREISLDREGVACQDEPGAIQEKCSNLRGVDLSYSLIPSWDVISLIGEELPSLERLALNNNRFRLFTERPSSRAFSKLIELQLSGTMTTWKEMLDIISYMPALKHVEMGYNRLKSLSLDDEHGRPTACGLELVNLDNNPLHDWLEIVGALKTMDKLVRLILTDNDISVIPHPSSLDAPLPWKYLSLVSTGVRDWTSIDALARWCPTLEGLSLFGTPLIEDPENSRIWRQVTIARLPVLRILDGASVSDRQRTDAELFYISMVARTGYPSDEARDLAHPRWVALCQKHETATETRLVVAKEDKLSSRLIPIKVSLVHAFEPPENSEGIPEPQVVRILPTAPLRTVRMKLLKSMKAPRGAKADLWVRMVGGVYRRIGESDGSDEGREIDWWLDEESEVVLCLQG